MRPTDRSISKIVLAFDSFKGSLSSKEAASACADAIRSILPDCEIATIPIADGGEGTVDAICAGSKLNADKIACLTADPLHRPITTYYEILSDGTAVIETASASGLPLLTESERNPLHTSTYGTGEQIIDALNRGCRKFIIGLGGSATNDAAMGILSALGYKFTDCSGNALRPTGNNLINVETIDATEADSRLGKCIFSLACDVDIPFYGNNGAAYVFAPQKGASIEQVVQLDAGLRHFAEVIKRTFHTDISALCGAGAAGGIGGTLHAILGAKLCSGIDIVLDYADFDSKIANADLIFTGEGSIDEQSVMGKTICGILHRAKKADVPVVALAGHIHEAECLNQKGLKAVFSIQQGPISLSDAMRPCNAAKGIYSTTSQILKLLK